MRKRESYEEEEMNLSDQSKDIGKGLEVLADNIRNGESMENYYAKTRIPRLVYLQAAHMMFRQTLKENGQ